MVERTTPVISRQNDPENITLLQASTVAYSRAKAGEVRITCSLLLLAVAYPTSYLYLDDETVRMVLLGFSFVLSILVQLLTPGHKRHTSKGALFKEEFDTAIFQLRWKSTLTRPDRSEVIHFARLYKGEKIHDWYSPVLSTSIDHNVAVAVFQHSNTSWDIGLRRMYRAWIVAFLTLYSMLLGVTFVLLNVDAMTVFLVLFSLLSFYFHFLALIRGHSEAIRRRESISRHLDEVVRTRRQVDTVELRDVQDEIFVTRQEAAKVPNFFFRWYRTRFNAEAEQYVREVNRLYGLGSKAAASI